MRAASASLARPATGPRAALFSSVVSPRKILARPSWRAWLRQRLFSVVAVAQDESLGGGATASPRRILRPKTRLSCSPRRCVHPHAVSRSRQEGEDDGQRSSRRGPTVDGEGAGGFGPEHFGGGRRPSRQAAQMLGLTAAELADWQERCPARRGQWPVGPPQGRAQQEADAEDG